MEAKQCIILAGGQGTRLRSEVSDLPKCMAPVAGKPFLHWVIAYLEKEGVTDFIFSLGYMHEIIETYIADNHQQLNCIFSVEDTPLGTGGAIQLALKNATEENVLIINGDTLFETDTKQMLFYHLENNAHCTLALKPMQDFERYGSVKTDEKKNIISFEEKKYRNDGLINGGVYLVNRPAFQLLRLPEKFSFEKDYLEKYTGALKMIGVADEGYFIDIGIPGDFKKANADLNKRINDPLR